MHCSPEGVRSAYLRTGRYWWLEVAQQQTMAGGQRGGGEGQGQAGPENNERVKVRTEGEQKHKNIAGTGNTHNIRFPG